MKLNEDPELGISKIIEELVELSKWPAKYFPKIKDDLKVFIFPAFVAAFISVATVSFRTFVQKTLYRMRFHDEQYQIMQEFYPAFQKQIIRLKAAMSEIENGSLCMYVRVAIRKYLEFEKDPEQYFQKNQQDIEIIELLCGAIKDFTDRLAEMNHFLAASVIPKPPLTHPFLARKIHKMMTLLYYYSFIWVQYSTEEIATDVFQKKMQDFKDYWKVEIGCAKMEEYLCLLDEWFLKF